jgi:hypothetical protein
MFRLISFWRSVLKLYAGRVLERIGERAKLKMKGGDPRSCSEAHISYQCFLFEDTSSMASLPLHRMRVFLRPLYILLLCRKQLIFGQGYQHGL